MLVPSKARNRPTAWNSLNMHAQQPLNHACTVAVYFLDAIKIRVVYHKSIIWWLRLVKIQTHTRTISSHIAISTIINKRCNESLAPQVAWLYKDACIWSLDVFIRQVSTRNQNIPSSLKRLWFLANVFSRRYMRLVWTPDTSDGMREGLGNNLTQKCLAGMPWF